MAADEDQAKATKPDGERRGGRDRRQRPPVTIDLRAEKVGDKAAENTAASPKPPKDTAGAEPAQAAAETAPQKEGAPRGRGTRPDWSMVGSQGWTRIVLAGATGGVIALFLVIVLQATGLLPVPGGSAANLAIEQAQRASNAATALDRRLMALEAMTEDLPSMRSDMDGLAATLSALDERQRLLAPGGDVEAVRTELAGLRARLDSALPPATRQELAGLASRVGRLEVMPPISGQSVGDGGAAMALAGRIGDAETALASLVERITAVEEKVATLGGGVGAASAGESAARAIAVVSLRRAAESGGPFAADLDLIAALGFASAERAQLRRFAETGVQSGAALAAQFPVVADAILSATTGADPDTGLVGRLVGNLRGLVSIRPTEPIAGDDPPAIVSRMQVAVAKGDLAAALAERDGLSPAGMDASAAWAARAADRATVDRLVEAIARSLDERASK